MIRLAAAIEQAVARAVMLVCQALMVMVVLVVLYGVVMRYVFLAPPFWGDLVAMFCNVGLVLLGLSLAIWRDDLIAMQALYERLPPRLSLGLRLLWSVLIGVFLVVFTWTGWQAARTVPGMFWELGGLPQTYPMMILPVSGLLALLATVCVVLRDAVRFFDRNAAGTN